MFPFLLKYSNNLTVRDEIRECSPRPKDRGSMCWFIGQWVAHFWNGQSTSWECLFNISWGRYIKSWETITMPWFDYIPGIERKSRAICESGCPVPCIAVHHVMPSELVTIGALLNHSSNASTGTDLSFKTPKYFAERLVDPWNATSQQSIHLIISLLTVVEVEGTGAAAGTAAGLYECHTSWARPSTFFIQSHSQPAFTKYDVL